MKRLTSEKADIRRVALRELVTRYVELAYTRSNLTAEQKTLLQTELERMRKIQADGLPAGRAFCPSCDGACLLKSK